MNVAERISDGITDHTKAIIAVMVLLTVALGAGAPLIESQSSLNQFQTDSPESEMLSYAQENFTAGDGNTTTAQIVVRDDDVLTKESFLSVLRFQQSLRDNETVNRTLVEDDAITGLPNVVAATAIRSEQAENLTERAEALQEANESLQEDIRELEAENETLREEFQEVQAANESLQADARELRANRSRLENRSDAVNETIGLLREGMDAARENPDRDASAIFADVQAAAPIELTDEHAATFAEAVDRLRSAESRSAAEDAYELGTQGVLADELQRLEAWGEALQERGEDLEERGDELAARGEELEERAAELEARAEAIEERGEELAARGEELEADREAIQSAETPSLSEQIEHLEGMSAGDVEEVIDEVLTPDGDGRSTQLFSLVPRDYEVGSAEANATMLVVTQETSLGTAVSGAADQETIDSQLAMQSIGDREGDGLEYMIFGSGIIQHEIDNSMVDSLAIVSPLALLFVLVALTVAYRDLLDIVLGLVGIGAVLTWTFGFMGWAGIDFNQVFVAVPVLLIGLSIDYAIHIFMRHREQRTDLDEASRPAMRVALAGVGVALVYVTATTAIGFLSNLSSPVPPIQEFGIVSAAGIGAALLIFGVFVPALKVELDELLESRGFDRRKRAFGTGGGRFSRVLAAGSTAAKRAPVAVLLLVLLVSAGAAYGGSQVDTEFNQSDFLADDPPEWMHDLPEAIRPGRYTAKSSIEFVNDNFVRQDARADILVEGEVTADDALERVEAGRENASEQPVTLTLADGEPAVESPLGVIHRVAAENATLNETVQAADTDGDGIPDTNLTGVYDALFEAAPDRAAEYVYRTDDGEYRALRLVVSTAGDASGAEVTEQMREVADVLTGGGLTATATGNAILNAIVQDQLLETVVESLLVTLVTIFAFLMVAYRLTDGSAWLGAVTLAPVALAVAWILGSMYLLGISFNVLTGMITSLTIGLGVAYSIHLSERYTLELSRQYDVWDAMDKAVTGTGGALLGSAATTIGGFGVLVFAILPPLRQFGLITALSIAFAFLGSVLALPSLLALWTRYAGPDWARAELTNDASVTIPGTRDRVEDGTVEKTEFDP